ncbi:hypothetical protein LPJ53_002286 [Coemansia erecta]|uniref:RING-type E3 ubiquitin transferase n=1 Tax=Coemansia erecta TaxID=147472 RepID=A0A9W7Y2J8_9FUNG|nr:hypothetical protein LPJ53_002286 [Coemansia erecta]
MSAPGSQPDITPPTRNADSGARESSGPSSRGRAHPGRGRNTRPAHAHPVHNNKAGGGGSRGRSGSNSNTASTTRSKGKTPFRPKTQDMVSADANDNDNNESDSDDKDVCFICADRVDYFAVGECDHRTCYRCNLRLRALFKSKACPYCKTELETIIYTTDGEAPFSDLSKRPLEHRDQDLNIMFDSEEAYNATKHMLQLNCPYRKCHYVDKDGWSGLKEHVRKEHSMGFCELCLKDKMSFAHEHRLYTKNQLKTHYSRGDGTGFTGHPDCQFCRISFYDNDQLYDHCRKKHEQCFICVRNGVDKQVYYANYNRLEDHFNRAHYTCRDPSCLEKKFIVFDNDIDLRSHELEEHSGSFASQKARRDAKQINVNFHYSHQRAPDVGTSGGGSSHESRGNRNKAKARQGADRSSPVPSTMTVNEPDTAGVSIAGRQRPTGFGRISDTGSASQSDAGSYNRVAAAQPPSEPGTPEPESNTLWPTLGSEPEASLGPVRDRAPADFGRLSAPSADRAGDAPLAAVSKETMASHQELLQRVSAYLSHREQPVSRFRQLTTKYKNDHVSADDYVQNCWLLFLTVPGKNAKEMIQKTMKSVSDLLPEGSQRNNLLKALSEHRIKQQQFPALTPLTSSTKSGDGSSARVLVIKQGSGKAQATSRSGWNVSAPSQSPSSAMSQRPGSYSTSNDVKRVSSSTGISSSAFPALGSSSSTSSLSTLASRLQIGASGVSGSGHNSYSSKTTMSGSFAAGGSSQRSNAGGLATSVSSGSSAFPDLPPASVPKRKVAPLNPNATSAWSAQDQTSSSNSQQAPSGRRQQRPNGKGKQVLFHVG